MTAARPGVPARPATVVLAPALAADGMVSIANYAAEIAPLLGQAPDGGLRVECLAPWWGRTGSPYVRAGVRYALYPAQVALRLRRSPRPDLLHVLHESYAHLLTLRAPAVATCHDLALFFHSDLTPAQMRRWERKVRLLRRARLVFADSACTRDDLVRLLGVAPERARVNPLGVGVEFRRVPAGAVATPVGRELQRAAGAQALLLHVGSTIKRKNIPVLLRALAALRGQGVPAVLVKAGWPILDGPYGALARELGLTDAIRDVGHVDRATLVELYSVCAALVLPSLYEGFGFPVLEAQSCGLPCVVARASSLPEVAGDAALYHAPEDADALAAAVRRLLTDTALREDLVAKGYRNAPRFAWTGHVARLREGYAEALA